MTASNQSTASLAVTANKFRGSRPNTSGHIGVTWHAASKKWTATVTLANPRKRKHVSGLYDTPAEAAAARAAFIEQHGTAAPIPRARVASTHATAEAA
ncbi:AP2 domain-containing protein [Paraburkholderia sp. SEWSISQ10-3 4]|uniref:AP2 domain-containing protein n=1 Tax=Paraburkholderia TaxID=1822464 RepID=UPI00224DFCEC|nr:MULTISPECIES: AP2 domain-containing protein [Paraburkholderia]MCX4137882.1 AP2 domain-containing protein [Paraburkholderia aspalathi]MDN7170573.1 AP2 domain-containing protein [Paraburkholderia sp. SEWSISQ10-3 4]MDQ6500212.1 AP2 domain-containing protein [Paraburkholderia aspalathi]